jgi:hypothetical protein
LGETNWQKAKAYQVAMATVKVIQKQKDLLLSHLRTVPIVEMACKRTRISRATFYRWCQDDEDFKESVENAKVDGVEYINDISESQLISLIKEKKYQAIALWLKNNHKRFMSEEKKDMLVRAQRKIELNAEQKELLKEALAHFK